MSNPTCMFAEKGGSFLTIERLDIDAKGNSHSSVGLWKQDELAICTRFETIDEQFDKRTGFFYCDEKNCKKCSFFKPILDKIIQSSQTQPSFP